MIALTWRRHAVVRNKTTSIMNMSNLPRMAATTCALAFTLLNGSTSTLAAATTSRPNILFLLVDDQRNDTLGCAGHPILQTPVIDSLATEGVRFRNAFVTTSICAASRASIFTGLHERAHGYTFGQPPVSAAHMSKSYPRQLREAGYRTGFIGKYGIATEGKPEPGMFDVFQSHGGPYFKEQPNGTLRHKTEICGDRATAFLDSNPEETPFCLSISFNAAHAVDGDQLNHYPWPKAVDGMYEDIEIPEPRLSDPAIFDAHPDFLKESFNRSRYFWRWDAPEKYQKNMKAYFRMLSGIDRVVGRIRQELEKREFAENTVIIYMGDNGYYMGDRGFAGKWSHYEQSLRVPLIVYDPRAPKRNRGAVLDEMALNIDVPATMLELAGVSIPTQYQGRSLVPLLQRQRLPDWRNDFFCEHLMNNPAIPKWEGVRTVRHVYARYFEQEPVYEYVHDLTTDPDQLHNLVDDPDYSGVLSELRARCNALKAEYELEETRSSNTSVQP